MRQQRIFNATHQKYCADCAIPVTVKASRGGSIDIALCDMCLDKRVATIKDAPREKITRKRRKKSDIILEG